MSSSDLLAAVTAAARDLLADRCGPARMRSATDPSFDPDLWAELSTSGWFDVLSPESVGGLELGAMGIGALFREAGVGLLPGPLLGAAVARPLLVEAGAEVPKGAIAIAALPSQGIGPAPVLTHDGEAVSATLAGIEHADVATTLLAIAERDGTSELLLLALDRARVERQISLDPLSRPCRVDLHEAPVLGIVRAPETVDRFRQLAWTATAHRCLGVVETAVDLAVQFSMTRQQFGRPIATFQALAHLLADLAALAAMTRSICTAAAHRDDTRTAHIALTFASRAVRTAVESSLQVHGGVGFTTDLDLHWYYRHGLALEVTWGMPSRHEQSIGRDAVAAAAN